LKVVDGARRATAPAAMALLEKLGAVDGRAAAKLASYARPPVHNLAGRAVGELQVRAAAVRTATLSRRGESDKS
jgi:L-asparaginase II